MELCLFGGAGAAVSNAYLEQAERFGACMAERGHNLVFGGGAEGMMGAVARGVHSRGGRVTGVAPVFFQRPGVLAPMCDELVLTETMHERKRVMRERADGFFIVPGGIGTLDEFFEVFTLRTLGRHEKPVALYNINGYYDELLGFLNKMRDEAFLAPSALLGLGVFTEPNALLCFMEAGA